MFFYKSLGNSFLILGEGVDIEDEDCWVQQQCEEYSSHGLIVYKKDKSEHKFSAKVFNSDGSDGQFSEMECVV